MSNFLTRNLPWLLAAILIAGLAVRAGAAVWWQGRLPAGQKFAFADSDSYWELARTISEGKTYQYVDDTQRVHRTPGYPLLLAALFWVTGGEPPLLAARLLGAVLGTLTVAGAGWLAWKLFDERAAVVAAALVAFDPAQIGASVFLLAEGPFTAMMVGQMLLWTAAERSECPYHRGYLGFLAGLAAGIATLLRPSWLLFTPLASLLAVAISADRIRQAQLGLLLLVGMVLPLVPWWIRNAGETGEFVPTTLQAGASLYDGLNPRATGGSEMSFVPPMRAEQRQWDRDHQGAPGTFETRLDRRMRDAALDWAGQNPGEAARLAVVKFLRMWSPWPNESELRSPWLIAVTACTYLPILLLGLWGAWRFAGRGWPYILCLLPAVYFTLLHVIFVASIRYRQPAMVLMAVLAAGVVASWWNEVVGDRWSVVSEPATDH